MCEKIIILKSGKITANDSLKNLLKKKNILQLKNFFWITDMLIRIIGLLIRYKNISFGSIPRLISIFYWPSVQILFWVFLQIF